jgi:signal transduction histidine kinase
VKLTIEGADAMLRVEDNGFGIAPELLPRVLDLFVQGERTGAVESDAP